MSSVVAFVFIPVTSNGDLGDLVNIILKVSPPRRLMITSSDFAISRTAENF
jgi:hypothetical protein